jgi:hypothetical protein
VALLLVACVASGEGDGASGTPPSAPSESTSTPTTAAERTTTSAAGGEDPGGRQDAGVEGCPDDDAVADLVGGPVDRTSSGGGVGASDGPSYSYEGCGYDLDGGGSVGVARVTLEGADEDPSDDDEPAYGALDEQARRAFATDGFEPIVDLGDEAYRDGTAVAVRHGDRMAFVEVTPSEADDATRAHTDATVLAVALLEVDLTLPPDQLCAAVEAAVPGDLGAVERVVPSSGVVGVDDVSFSTSGCAIELADGAEAEVDVAAAEPWAAWVEAKQGSGFRAGYAATEVDGRAGFDTGDTLVVDDGERPLRITTEDLDLDVEAAAVLRRDLAALALADG